MKTTKYFRNLFLMAAVFFAGLSVLVPSQYGDGSIIAGSAAKAAGSGGPIVLDGMDPVCHASYGEGTYQYIGKVVKSVYDQSSIPANTGAIAILGVSSLTSAGGCGGNWTTLLNTKFLTPFTSAPTYQFITTAAELDTFFSTTITSTPPKMLWIPDDWSRSGTINSKFTANAEKIADFVNSGGGLFASNNTYGWLTALLPSAVFNNGGCNGGPEATADGTTDFGLTNAMVAACWHGYFTGNVGTLKVLVDYPYPSSSSTRKAVSIGGGSVSLPSSFTLAISPTNPAAGTPLTITATAQTIAGVPQAGVTVSMTVSSGPDAGQTFTAVTDASGIATITVNTSSVGTNVYTATATVSGVTKTVSTTVTWAAPPTTTAAPTTTSSTTTSSTTTGAPTTTTLVTTTTNAPSTTHVPVTTSAPTTVVEVVTPSTSSSVPETTVVESPSTTIHDHSSHEHSLPHTGNDALRMYAIALFMLSIGCVLILSRKINSRGE